MPVSYFTSKPFENWSRGGPQMTGTVFLQLDHSAPIDGDAHSDCRSCSRRATDWDGRAWSLVVTDTTPSTIEVRAPVTARDLGRPVDAALRVREQLLDWLQREHAYALPSISLASAEDQPRGDGTASSNGYGRRPDPQESRYN